MASNILTKRVERFPSIFDEFFTPWNEMFKKGDGWGRTLTVPAVNVSENQNDFTLSLAAPGLKKDDFDIDVDGNILTISSEKEESMEETKEQYTRQEYSYSSFKRSFTMPDEVNLDKIDAAYADGVLKITMPKKEKAKVTTSKQISVK